MSLKRKIATETIKTEEDSDSESENAFFNVINGDEIDSSDSEGSIDGDEDDVEDSDEDEESEGDVEEEDVEEDGNNSDKLEEVNSSSECSDSSDDSTNENDLIKETIESSNTTNKTIENSDVIKETSLESDDDEESDSNIPNEYEEYDTSDEEDIRNTVGNIPMNWYDDYKHLGYDWDGNKIIKPISGDQLDEFLKKIEDPDFWRTVKDPQTGQSVVLSEDDIALIKRIRAGKTPDPNVEDSGPWINWFTREVMEMPLRKFPDHKRSFLPSKHEERKVSKMVHALKMGWLKTIAEQEKLKAKKDPQFYMLWTSDDQSEEMRRIHKHIAAPKRHLPGHGESYNPPHEYLFDDKEMKQWNKLKNAPWKRKLHFVPQKYDSLRKVPSYSRYIKERFLRCLDLYLCPRAIKMKLNIEPESLVPKLPSPKDLQPFPTVLSLEYKGHKDMVRCISCDKIGQYLVSGSDDCTIKLWEINTGRCIKTIPTGDVVRSVLWCPNQSLSLILVASGKRVLLINPHVGDFLINNKTDAIIKEKPQSEVIVSEQIRTTIQWEEPNEDENSRGICVVLKHFKEVTRLAWHGRGDYFATVMPEGQNRSVLISQISRRRSQLPFTKSKGLVQCVSFHPTKPFLFVATQRHVRIYDLMKQMLVKKLLTNSRWVSTIDVHPGGDNLLVGTYDRKMLWFDLDLSTKPYQTLRLHGTAVRGVAFHKRYPLFASGSDDRSLIISHGMVYNDLLQNPLIVPLKRLQDHESKNDFGIFDVIFHPLQPWVFSSGADGTIKLYTN